MAPKVKKLPSPAEAKKILAQKKALENVDVGPKLHRDSKGFDQPTPSVDHPSHADWLANRLARIEDVFGEGQLSLTPIEKLVQSHDVPGNWPHRKQYERIYKQGSDIGPIVTKRDGDRYQVLDGNGRMTVLPKTSLENVVTYVLGNKKGPQSYAELADHIVSGKKLAAAAPLALLAGSQTEMPQAGETTSTSPFGGLMNTLGDAYKEYAPKVAETAGQLAQLPGQLLEGQVDAFNGGWADPAIAAIRALGRGGTEGAYQSELDYLKERRASLPSASRFATAKPGSYARMSPVNPIAGKMADMQTPEGQADFEAYIDQVSNFAGTIKTKKGGKKAADAAKKAADRLSVEKAAEGMAEQGVRSAEDEAVAKMVRDVLKHHNKKGGSTYSPTQGRLLTKKDGGYAVGMYPHLTEMVKGELTPQSLEQYLNKVKDVLAESPDNHLGTWRNPDTKTNFLDVVRVPKESEAAQALGEARREQAFFDLKRGRDVPVNYDEHMTKPQLAATRLRAGTRGHPVAMTELPYLFRDAPHRDALRAAHEGVHIRMNPDGSIVGAPKGFTLDDIEATRAAMRDKTIASPEAAGFYPTSAVAHDIVLPQGRVAEMPTTSALFSPKMPPGNEAWQHIQGRNLMDVNRSMLDDSTRATAEMNQTARSFMDGTVDPLDAETGFKRDAYADQSGRKRYEESNNTTADRWEARNWGFKDVGRKVIGEDGKAREVGMQPPQNAYIQGEGLVTQAAVARYAAEHPEWVAKLPDDPRYGKMVPTENGSYRWESAGIKVPVDVPASGQSARWFFDRPGDISFQLTEPRSSHRDAYPVMAAVEQTGPGWKVDKPITFPNAGEMPANQYDSLWAATHQGQLPTHYEERTMAAGHPGSATRGPEVARPLVSPQSLTENAKGRGKKLSLLDQPSEDMARGVHAVRDWSQGTDLPMSYMGRPLDPVLPGATTVPPGSGQRTASLLDFLGQNTPAITETLSSKRAAPWLAHANPPVSPGSPEALALQTLKEGRLAEIQKLYKGGGIGALAKLGLPGIAALVGAGQED